MARSAPQIHLRLIICVCLMLPTLAWAQGSGDSRARNDVSAALGAEPRANGRATPEIHELRTDGLTATVTVLRTGRPFPAGGSAFAQIKLSNTANAKWIGAELLLDPETAVIRDVSGPSVAVRERGETRIASIEKIVKGKPRTVIVEVILREGHASADPANQPNKLNITLRRPGGAGETATLGWTIANCAGGFYSEIVKVREGSGAGTAEAIKAAGSPDRSRPGRWLFPPKYRTATANRKCIRRARRWSSRRGRYVYRCTKFETLAPVATSGATPVKSEGKIYRFASRFVRTRGVDRELSRTRDSGWAARRVSQNLQAFLNQDRHPAICSGTIQTFDYLGKRMEGFARRAKTFDEMAGKSWSLAQLRTSDAAEAAKADPGGHPGWGAAPLDLPRTSDETTLKSRVATLAQLTADLDLSERVSDASTTFAALRIMADYFKGDAAKSLAEANLAAIYRALSAIEAADYIGTVARHYTDLRHMLLGSMSTIRQAHARNCTCDG